MEWRIESNSAWGFEDHQPCSSSWMLINDQCVTSVCMIHTIWLVWQKWDKPRVTMKAEMECKWIVVIFQIDWDSGDMVRNILYRDFCIWGFVLVPQLTKFGPENIDKVLRGRYSTLNRQWYSRIEFFSMIFAWSDFTVNSWHRKEYSQMQTFMQLLESTSLMILHNLWSRNQSEVQVFHCLGKTRPSFFFLNSQNFQNWRKPLINVSHGVLT